MPGRVPGSGAQDKPKGIVFANKLYLFDKAGSIQVSPLDGIGSQGLLVFVRFLTQTFRRLIGS